MHAEQNTKDNDQRCGIVIPVGRKIQPCKGKHRARHAACGTRHPCKGANRTADAGEAENQSVRTKYGENKQVLENEFVFILH